MGKILIAYFSRADENYTPGGFAVLKKGNTEIAAETAQAAAGGDLFRIERSKPYPAGYRDCVEESKKELLSDARPELADKLKDIKAYDTVVLAYPCWCGTMPMPVFTFLESVDFTGKKILPLCTNEGSGMGSSERDIRRICPDALVARGLPVQGSGVSSADKLISDWLWENL